MMRTALVLSVLLVAFSGCNLEAPDTGSSSGPAPVDSSHVQIQTSNGYEELPVNSISAARIQIYNSNLPCANQLFPEGTAVQLLSRIALNAPREYEFDGTVTGDVTIYFNEGGQTVSKNYIIKNYTTLEDSNYPQVHYQASGSLDTSWIGCTSEAE